MGYIFQTILAELVPMCVTMLVTLAITMIFKTSFTTNFAQGLVSAFGAYVVATLFSSNGLPIWLCIPLGAIVAVAMAVAVDVFIFRNGRYVNALGKQIITMGLMSILASAIPLIFGATAPQIQPFVSGNLYFTLFGYEFLIQKNALVCIAITAILISVIFILLRFSKWGLSVRATASNEYVAGMMGINTHVVTAISWGLAGALGAVAATLTATQYSINIYFMTNYQVNAFLAGILGGFATFYGPVVAAALIPLANAVVFALFNLSGASENTMWTGVIVYAIALLVIFFKPAGIFGKKLKKKV